MATYKIDVDYSEIMFRVKHLMISTVSGNFKKFDGTIEVSEADLSDAVITFEADADSIDTKNEQRDGHLKSDDFFNAAQFPKLTFQSTGIKSKGGDEYLLTGDFTIRDVTNSIALQVTYNGNTIDPWGMERMGFEISGKINRKEYGLKWSALTEAGGMVVAEDVKLEMNIEVVKQN